MTAVRDLHLTSPPMRGADVLNVQTLLATLGYSPGPLDGAYGPATAAAVERFQRAHSLTADGIFGPATRARLRTSSSAKPAETPGGHPLVHPGLLALQEAKKWLGTAESPMNSNRTRFGVWFGLNGVPWCNIFVSWCFEVGASYMICRGSSGAGVVAGRGCSYVPTTEGWLRSNGMWIGRTAPPPGAIAIYNWDGGNPDHIGIVEEYLGGGQFTAIEGNTSVGNDSNGGQVMRRTRYLTQVDGFGLAR